MEARTRNELVDTLINSEPDIRRIMKAHATPSVSIMLSDPQNSASRTFTLADNHLPVRDSDEQGVVIYGIASASKLFICYLLQLTIEVLAYEKEALKALRNCWNRQFDEVLEEVSDGKTRVELKHKPTVLDLLSHFRAFPSMNDTLLNVDGYPIISKQEFMEVSPRLLDLVPQPKNPGSGSIQYSNANFIWLEILLEQGLGRPIEQLIKDYILSPFEMHHTYTSFDDIPQPLHVASLAVPCIQQSDGTSRPVKSPNRYSPQSAISVSLGMYSCVQDLNKFYGKVREGIMRLNAGEKGDMAGLWSDYLARGSLLSRDGTSPHTSTKYFKTGNQKQTSDSIQYFSALGLVTELNTDGPGSLSFNRLSSASNDMANYQLQSKGEPQTTLYTAWARTGYCGTSYFMPSYGLVVIVLGNAGPFDAANHISRLLIQNYLDLNEPALDIPIADLCESTVTNRLQKLKAWEHSLTDRGTRNDTITIHRGEFPNIQGRYICKEKGTQIQVYLDGERIYLRFLNSISNEYPPYRLKPSDDRVTIIPNEISNDQLGDWEGLTLYVQNDSSLSSPCLVRVHEDGKKDFYIPMPHTEKE